jgi:hypothetical protein
MINEMWNIIEKRAQTDDRYQAPKRFLVRTFESDHEICEVDLFQYSYGVKGIRIEECHSGYKSIIIVAHDGQYYSGLDTESVCVLLTALRRQRQRTAEWKRTQERIKKWTKAA